MYVTYRAWARTERLRHTGPTASLLGEAAGPDFNCADVDEKYSYRNTSIRRVIVSLLEIIHDAILENRSFADVNNLPLGIAMEVHAGLGGVMFDLWRKKLYFRAVDNPNRGASRPNPKGSQ